MEKNKIQAYLEMRKTEEAFDVLTKRLEVLSNFEYPNEIKKVLRKVVIGLVKSKEQFNIFWDIFYSYLAELVKEELTTIQLEEYIGNMIEEINKNNNTKKLVKKIT